MDRDMYIYISGRRSVEMGHIYITIRSVISLVYPCKAYKYVTCHRQFQHVVLIVHVSSSIRYNMPLLD